MRELAPRIATLVLLAATSAIAQQESVAEALFREGRQSMEAGAYEQACSKLAESYRLEPAAGTLLNLATCERQLGHLATAWTKFKKFLDTVPEADDRRPFARAEIATLEKDLPKLDITVDERDADARVLLDGVELRSASFGVDIPVDPGAHRIVLTRLGQVVNERTVSVATGERIEVEVSASREGVRSPPVEPARSTDGGKTPPSRPIASSHASDADPSISLRRAGYVVGGVGLAGLAGAGVLTGLSLGKRSDVDHHCQWHACDATGVDAAAAGARLLRAADVALVVGSVGVAIGGFLLFRAASVRVGFQTGPRAASATITGVLR